MIDKMVASYRKMQLAAIAGLAGNAEDVIFEAGFYDDGFMQAQINRVTRELEQISRELKLLIEVQSKDDQDRKRELLEQHDKRLYQLVFLLSNRIENIEKCRKLMKGYGTEFTQCLDALECYQNGEHKQAFHLLENYYLTYKHVEGHFLINKIFGLLLRESGKTAKAIPFLTYALSLKPDDEECLACLADCYKQQKDTFREQIVREISQVVTG